MDRPVNENRSGLDRRTFIKRLTLNSGLAAGTLAAAYAFKSSGLLIQDPRAEEEGHSREREIVQATPQPLAVARGDDPAASTREALKALGGMEKFVAPRDRVLVKPNVGWDRRPKFAANTNPHVVRAVVEMCLEAGAQKVWVTDSPCNLPDRCFDKSGLKKALDGTEADLFVPTERDYSQTDLRGEVVRKWPVLKVLLESDKVINVPIAKHHSSAILSMGMKNWFGILGGGNQRGQLHQEMALSIAELAEFVRPALTILDAHRILIRNGPQGGSLLDTKETKTIVASADAVAVDAYGAGLFDLKPEEVPYIPLAAEKGLGFHDLERIEIIEAGT